MEKDFGEKLKLWRNKTGLSQNALAEKSGVSPVTIGQIETGKRNARRQTLLKLIDGLGISEAKFHTAAHIRYDYMTSESGAEIATAKVEAGSTNPSGPVALSNLDLEIINRTLNLSFEGKLQVIRYLNGFK